jgi:hypothetical protein
MDAISTDETVKACADRFHGVTGFNKNPYLDHVTRFPIVAGMREAGGDDHTVLILVENESVHREPPLTTVNRKLCPVVSFLPLGYPIKAANSTMERLRV